MNADGGDAGGFFTLREAGSCDGDLTWEAIGSGYRTRRPNATPNHHLLGLRLVRSRSVVHWGITPQTYPNPWLS